MMEIFFTLCLVFVTLVISEPQDHTKFCGRNMHYTDPSFTCCAKQEFEGPPINPFLVDENMKTCLDQDNIKKADKVVAKSWLLYECLLKRHIPEELTIDSFMKFMTKSFSPPIKNEIKSALQEFKAVEAYKAGRTRREADDQGAAQSQSNGDAGTTKTVPTDSTASTVASTSGIKSTEASPGGNIESSSKASVGGDGASSSEASKSDTTGSSVAPKVDGGSTSEAPKVDGGSTSEAPKVDGGSTSEAPKVDGGSTSEAPKVDGGSTLEAPKVDGGSTSEAPKSEGAATNDGRSTSEVPKVDRGTTSKTYGGTTSEAPKDDVPSNTEPSKVENTPEPRTPIPLFRYLSANEYYDEFKESLPNENVFQIWDMYYTAELKGCHLGGGSTLAKIKEYNAEHCYGWMIRTGRRGDCCGAAPVPFSLLYDRIIDKQYILNFTAEKVLNLAGTYTWTNLSFSSNINRCYQLSESMIQGHLTPDDLKKEIDEFITLNGTTSPDYKKIAAKLIPPYYPSTSIDKMVKDMLPPMTTTTARGAEKPMYTSLDYETNIQQVSTFTSSIYEWAIPSEWSSLDVNRTRYLMWTCDVYRMISQRILQYDITPFCY